MGTCDQKSANLQTQRWRPRAEPGVCSVGRVGWGNSTDSSLALADSTNHLLEPLSQAAGVGGPQRHGHSEIVNITNLENWGHN